ncbi:MAG: hypothetical protein Q8K70_11175 [Bacteroidota bacterium]|nr:hypothetical protein [Bacteroidota bacterium]
MEKHIVINTVVYGLIIIGLPSCSVTNNIYINETTPFEDGKGVVSLGIGTGLIPKIDSVSDNGDINFNNKISIAPNFYLGVQGGIKNRINYRASINLPFIIGGFGQRGGAQYSFLPKESKFNFAVGIDLGFVASKDSVKILGSRIGVNPHTNGITNADIFMPFTLNINENSRFTITPRYIHQYFWIKYNVDSHKSYSYIQSTIGLSAGLKYKSLYIESTMLSMNNRIFPVLGIGFITEF